MRAKRVPKFRRNPDGRGFSQWKRKRYYFGPYDSAEAASKYAAFIKRLSNEDESQPATLPGKPCIVGELCGEYLRFARGYYSSDGTPTKEYTNVKHAILPFMEVCGLEDISKFGPVAFTEYQTLLAGSLRRGVVNSRIGRIKRMFKWCTQRELIHPSIFHAMSTVSGLRAGRTNARESEPIRPVAMENVRALLPFVNRQVGTMMLVQYFAGMRSGEVIRMRPCDIDRTREIWLYRPETHKSAHLGQSLVKAIPKVAQQILAPFMDRQEIEYLFSPQDVADERRKLAAMKRKRKRSRKNKRYSTDTYRQAICHGLRKAEKAKVKIKHFHPHQLRHTVATEIASGLGVDAARTWLGHSQLDSTQIYVEKQQRELIEIAKQLDLQWGENNSRQSAPGTRTKRRQPQSNQRRRPAK